MHAQPMSPMPEMIPAQPMQRMDMPPPPPAFQTPMMSDMQQQHPMQVNHIFFNNHNISFNKFHSFY